MPGCASARGAAKALASLPSALDVCRDAVLQVCFVQGCYLLCYKLCFVAMRWPKVIILATASLHRASLPSLEFLCLLY